MRLTNPSGRLRPPVLRAPLLRPRTLAAAAIAACAIAAAAWFSPVQAGAVPHVLPAPAQDIAIPPGQPARQTATFAGGCFWGIQGVFQHVKGVTQAVSGYAGGAVANPGYELVSSGSTGHAESVQVTFDPAKVSYGKLLQIFFSVALDPTELNRQGPDWGTQYRSELFVSNPDQERVARAYIAQLDAAHAFEKPIVTKIDAAGPFYKAEGYHQDYLTLHPDAPYIAINDMPKVNSLQTLFPENWAPVAVTVAKAAGTKAAGDKTAGDKAASGT